MHAAPTRTPGRAVVARALAALASVLILATALVGVEFTFSSQPQPAEAANGADFNPGMIISDAEFYDWSSMNAAEVQAFLDSKVSSCQAGYTCLKDYAMSTPTWGGNAYCGPYNGGYQSAAQIIVGVAQACGISPKVLIVTLQKETSLITLNAPSAWRYERAMGYYCPDDPNNPGFCHPDYAGFFNQLYNASWQFKEYRANPGDYNYQAGRYNKIGYHPKSWQDGSCPFANVYIENQATAALYIYTPYVPNQTALADLYGASSDGCSSYGNRNFWREYTDWFGANAKTPYDPFGGVDTLTGGRGVIQLAGWAADPDQPTSPLYIWVTIDGVGQYVLANRYRADLERALPGYGGNHGFDAKLAAKVGNHQVCVTASNVGRGRHTSFTCKTVTVTGDNPYGTIDSVTAGLRNVNVRGWTVDGDGTPPRYVWVDVDGTGQPLVLNQPRPDVQQALPWAELNTGYQGTVSASPGPHKVCVTAVNSGPGLDTSLGCRQVTVLGDNPAGSIDEVSLANGTIQLKGWTADANDPSASLYVWVTVDGRGHYLRANGSRPDVARVYPTLGPNHGYQESIPVSPGQHTVCVDVQNVGAGANSNLGCARLG